MVKKKGLLLVNIGSPKSTETKDVRRYLKAFLMDKYVLDLPWILRAFIVYCFILPFRPKKSGAAYASIWEEEGSPLVFLSERLTKKISLALPNLSVKLGMSYESPNIKDAFKSFKEEGITEIFVMPQFPHYAYSTTLGIENLCKTYQMKDETLNLSFNLPFYKDQNYITALVKKSNPYLTENIDYLLFSYHGVPERQVKRCDPTKMHCLTTPNCCEKDSPVHELCYKAQTVRTTSEFIKHSKWHKPYGVAYQSRLGKDPWLSPATDETLIRLAKEGVKKIAVICPAFTVDCLETLEEIGEEGRDLFLEHGGQKFTLIPCLNDSQEAVDFMKQHLKSNKFFKDTVN